ncbi:MAG: RagB/SusD family nutrient uptake outer membrane protein, partial [Candidatus Saccharibacteria bacterium]
MKNRFLKYSAGLATAALLFFTSCNEMDLAPTNKFTEATYWTSPEKAEMVLNMAYSQMSNSDYFFNSETLSDNLYEGRGVSSEKTISSGQADASNGRFKSEWADSYAGIKTCHIFLENVDRIPKMDETLKTRMKAEARFIRAFLYFRLANWYGDVPLFDHDLTLTEAKSVTRTPKAEVIAFVQSELDAIIDQLPTKDKYEKEDKGRITSGAVAALKARIYLYDNDWANVATWCEKLINTSDYGTYSLFPSYEGLFLPENENNDEVILDLGYVPVLRTWSNFRDVVPVSIGNRVNSFAPTQELVDNYIMLNGKTINAAGSGYSETTPYKNRDPRLTATVVYDQYQWKKPDGTVSTIYIKPGTFPRAKPNDPAPDEYKGQGSNTTSTGYYLR